MLILRTLKLGPQHGHGIGVAIRAAGRKQLNAERSRWTQLSAAIARIMDPV
jgi:hypothetical protein